MSSYQEQSFKTEQKAKSQFKNPQQASEPHIASFGIIGLGVLNSYDSLLKALMSKRNTV